MFASIFRRSFSLLEVLSEASAHSASNWVLSDSMATEKADTKSHTSDIEVSSTQLLESPGVQRIEAISNAFTLFLRVALFVGIFLLSYVYGLGV